MKTKILSLGKLFDFENISFPRYSKKYRIQQEILCMGLRVESVENDISYWLINDFNSFPASYNKNVYNSFPESYTRRILNFDHR